MKCPVVDLGECILCGVCEDVCPEVFQQNDAGFIQVIERDVYPEADVEAAIRNCPYDCIAWDGD
jgi:ferredoxin